MVDVLLVNPDRNPSYFTEKQRSLSYNSVLLLVGEYFFPMEFFYIPKILEEKGVSAKVVDMHLEGYGLDDLKAIIGKEKPEYVVVPTDSYWNSRCPIPFTNHTARVSNYVKREFPEIKVISYGSHGIHFPEQTFKELNADVLIQGAPERKILEVVEKFSDLKEVKGIAFKQEGKVVQTGGMSELSVDELPIADFGVIDFEKYRQKSAVNVFASRGCPYGCTFCSNQNFGKYTQRSAEKVVAELKDLKKRGVKRVHFFDDTFALVRGKAVELLDRMIEEDLGIEWDCLTRFDLTDREILEKMKKSGCYKISYGLESASQEILDGILKRIKKETIVEVLKDCREVGITANLFVISFLPGETEETLKETKKFLAENQVDSFSIAAATPLPGSPLWRQEMQKGTMKNGTYEESLSFAGMVQNNFSKEEVQRRVHTFPTEVALASSGKFKKTLIKKALKNPKQAVHYLRKLAEYVKNK